MARQRYVLSLANLLLIAGGLSVGLAFFGPFWLANVNPNELPGMADASTQNNNTYFLYMFDGLNKVDALYLRGLWGQCGYRCQPFWMDEYKLQKSLFTPLKWHLATQILYFIGAALVLIGIIYAQVQICCRERACAFRVLGGILLFSFCLQTAAIAVFGGGAWKAYSAKSRPILDLVDWSTTKPGEPVYFDWCYWTAIVGGSLTLFSGTLYLVYDCCLSRYDPYDK